MRSLKNPFPVLLAESKELLVKQCKEESVQFLTLNGRRGGSAMAAAAVNSLMFDG